MDSWSLLVLITLLLLHSLGILRSETTAQSNDCFNNSRCVDCRTADICRRCSSAFYVLPPNGQCVVSCPGGSTTRYTVDAPFQGKICDEAGTATTATTVASTGGNNKNGGLGSVEIGVIAGAVPGVLIVFVVAGVAVYIFNSRREAVLSTQAGHISMQQIQHAPSNQTPVRRPAQAAAAQRAYETLPEVPEGGPESPRALPDDERVKMEQIFGEKLGELRPQAEKILEMLNATNKRRKSTQNKEEQARLKLAMDDIATVLRLINKKPSKLYVPGGGVQLLEWVDKLLQSYKAAEEKKAKEVAEETHF